MKFILLLLLFSPSIICPRKKQVTESNGIVSKIKECWNTFVEFIMSKASWIGTFFSWINEKILSIFSDKQSTKSTPSEPKSIFQTFKDLFGFGTSTTIQN